MDNDTMLEVFKHLNCCQLANSSLVSKRFWNLLRTNRHSLALLSVKCRMRMSNSFDYDDVVIVAEKEWFSARRESATVELYDTLWNIEEDVNAEDRYCAIDRVSCQKLRPDTENCHAEVLFVSDFSVAEDNKFREKFVPDRNQDEFNNRSKADVAFVVNGQEFKADRQWMAMASPSFFPKLYGEQRQDKIELDDNVSAVIFKDFLLALSPLCIQPNPSNVVALLKLAHKYDVLLLKHKCEDHLMLCYELTPADRYVLAIEYNLNRLKSQIIFHSGIGGLESILTEKRGQLNAREIDSLQEIIDRRTREYSVDIQNAIDRQNADADNDQN
ncbi:BTB/POZ domain-containing protein [Ditylenchus destructor]|nr:BTB/POZ domain-containing protein [Ditylenchus destructor]